LMILCQLIIQILHKQLPLPHFLTSKFDI
jgi:hypothetical protein